MKRVLPLLLALSSAAPCLSSDSFQFLELQTDARRAALGGAGVALPGDAAGAAANPAALAEAGRDELSFSYMSYVEDASLGVVSYAHPLAAGGGLGLRAVSMNYGTLDGYDVSGGKTASYAARDLSLSAGYGRNWGETWRWGASLGQAQSSLADASAQTLEGSLGVLWAPPGSGPLSRLRLGAAARHLGAGGSFERESASLPRTMVFGASWKGFSESWVLAADVEKPRTGPARFLAGQEVWLSRVLALRMGWRSDQDLTGALVLGLGARFKDFQVDYAFASGTGVFANAHRVGLSWRFGGQVEAFYQEAARLMQKGDTAEAVLVLKKVLDLEPRHRRALALMREAAERMKEEDPGQ